MFDGQRHNIAMCVSSALKGRFRCAASSRDQHETVAIVIKHTHTKKKIVLKLSQLPASNHSLHRFLSVFTVGHPSNGVDLLVGPSAGER